MASLEYRLNYIYTIKECSSCGSLYNKERCCSKGGFVDKFVRDPNKTPDSSQRPPPNCPKCGNPVDGLYCRQCALLRKKLKEVWSTICYEDEIFQDFLNTSESSNDKTNVVNAPQEPFVFNQDPGENSSQRPPHIDHHCCYGCGDSLDGIFCQRCTCESCGNGAHYGYNCPPKVPTISNPEPCHNQNVDEFPQTLPSFHPTCYSGDGSSFTYDSTPNFVDDSPNVFNPPSQPPTYSCEFCGNDAHYEQVVNLDTNTPEPSQCQKIPICYNDDDDEESSIPLRDIIISELPPCIAITPVLSIEEPDNSLSMGDEHLDTILATEPDEVIKSSVEDLVPIPSESEGISDKMCDVSFRDNSPPLDISKDQFEDFSDSNNDSTSINDDSFSIDNIDYVEASPPHSELVSLEEVKDFHPEDGELEDGILREKLSKINLLIAKIEALKDNPTPSSDFMTKSPSTSPNSFLEETNISYNSLPESETFCFNLEEKSSGNPTSYTDLSLPDYKAFFCDSEPDLEDFTMYSFMSKSPIPKNSGSTTIPANISLPDLKCFYFKSEPDLGDLTSIIDPEIRENVSSTTNVNLPFQIDQSPLFAYVVWIFLYFLTYPIAPPYLLSSENEDIIFDPNFSIYHSFMMGVSHQSGTFMKFNVYLNHLNESMMEILSSTGSPMDQ
ncbi:hypothetical protein Tco_0944784 [Tanacetum coccineum]